MTALLEYIDLSCIVYRSSLITNITDMAISVPIPFIGVSLLVNIILYYKQT